MIKDNVKELEIAPASNNNTIFLRAKATNQKQFLTQYEEKCNTEEEEDCTIDHVYVYVMPTGEFEHLRIHTFNKMKQDEDYMNNNLQY